MRAISSEHVESPTQEVPIPTGCSKWTPNKAAGEKKPEADHSHPPNPELSEQLFSQVSYGEHLFEPRTTIRRLLKMLR